MPGCLKVAPEEQGEDLGGIDALAIRLGEVGLVQRDSQLQLQTGR